MMCFGYKIDIFSEVLSEQAVTTFLTVVHSNKMSVKIEDLPESFKAGNIDSVYKYLLSVDWSEPWLQAVFRIRWHMNRNLTKHVI
jgi:hypothetical protein